jgi:protein TonB
MNRKPLITLMMVVVVAVAAHPIASRAQDAASKSAEPKPIYHVGDKDVTPPRPIYTPEPEYDDAARRAKVSGRVLLSMIVTKDGQARDVTIVKSLSPGLDKKSIEAVSRWKFKPGTKDGEPVAVQLKVETSFRIR